MDPVIPFMLVDGDQEAMDFHRTPGSYDNSLSGDPKAYVEGDLVCYVSGKVQKCVETDPTKLPTLYLAGQSWHQPFAKPYLLAAGVPLNVIPKRNRFVMTFRDSSGGEVAFDATDQGLVDAQAEVDVAYVSAIGGLAVLDSTTGPRARLKRVWKGGVGVTNTQVLVELVAEA